MALRGSKPIYPPVYWLTAALFMLGLHFSMPIRQVVQGRFRYLGVLLLAAELAVILWAARIFDRTGTTIKPFEQSSALVLRGPYRLSRNPIYLGMVCGLVGIALLAGSLTPFLVVPLFAAFIDRRFIRVEETQLRQTFGSAYDAYTARVPRWL
jgi:protein-S-isoprenylcysteine O-methyltransferase Ste14